MAKTTLLCDVLGGFGTLCAALLFISPAANFKRIVAMRSVGDYDSSPVLATLLQCALWMTYGSVTADRIPVVVTNGLGVVVQLLWCALFFTYTTFRRRFAMRVGAVILLWSTVTIVDFVYFSRAPFRPDPSGPPTGPVELGIACVVCNIIMFVSPLKALWAALATRSVRDLPVMFCVMVFINASFWLAYSLSIPDYWVFVPNACGVTFGALQLGLCWHLNRGGGPAVPARSVEENTENGGSMLCPMETSQSSTTFSGTSSFHVARPPLDASPQHSRKQKACAAPQPRSPASEGAPPTRKPLSSPPSAEGLLDTGAAESFQGGKTPQK